MIFERWLKERISLPFFDVLILKDKGKKMLWTCQLANHECTGLLVSTASHCWTNILPIGILIIVTETITDIMTVVVRLKNASTTIIIIESPVIVEITLLISLCRI
jgi:hypothetical protein